MEARPVKRSEMGLAGILIVFCQVLSSFHSDQNIYKQFEKFKDEFAQNRVDSERFFVRKTDLEAVTQRLDKMNEQLIILTEKVNSILDNDYAFSGGEPGCSLAEEEDPWLAYAVEGGSTHL